MGDRDTVKLLETPREPRRTKGRSERPFWQREKTSGTVTIAADWTISSQALKDKFPCVQFRGQMSVGGEIRLRYGPLGV